MGQPKQAKSTVSIYRSRPKRKLLPDDPLVRWVIWFILAISIGAPLLAALVLVIVR